MPPEHKLASSALIAFGTVALVVPLVLARRARRAHVQNYFPPPRSASLRPVPHSHIRHETPSTPSTASERVEVNAPLRSLAAISIATFAVGGMALASVRGVKRAWNVNTIEEFTRRMQIELSILLPHLSSAMRGGLLADSRDQEHQHEDVDTWDYEASSERLAMAYDKGGLSLWADVAWKELQMESKVLLGKRQHGKLLEARPKH